jgi:hypothetical protein
MAEVSSLKSDVLHELASFFEISGFFVSGSMIGGEEAINVFDRRGEDWTLSYTAKTSEDGKKLLVTEYSVSTPKARISQQDEFVLLITDEETDTDTASFTYFDKEPLSFDLNETFLKMIIEHPVHLFFYEALKNRKGLSEEFVEDLAKRVWDYGENTDQRTELLISYFAKKFSS